MSQYPQQRVSVMPGASRVNYSQNGQSTMQQTSQVQYAGQRTSYVQQGRSQYVQSQQVQQVQPVRQMQQVHHLQQQHHAQPMHRVQQVQQPMQQSRTVMAQGYQSLPQGFSLQQQTMTNNSSLVQRSPMNSSRTVQQNNMHKSPMSRLPIQSTFQSSPMQAGVLGRGVPMGQGSMTQMTSPVHMAGTPMRSGVPVVNPSGFVMHNKSSVVPQSNTRVMSQEEFLAYKSSQDELVRNAGLQEGNVFQGNGAQQQRTIKQVREQEQENKEIQQNIDKLLQRSQAISANQQKNIQAHLDNNRKQSHSLRKRSQSSQGTQDLKSSDELVLSYMPDHLAEHRPNEVQDLDNNDPAVLGYLEDHLSQDHGLVDLDNNDPIVLSYMEDHLKESKMQVMDCDNAAFSGHSGTLVVMIQKATQLPTSIFDKTDGFVKGTLNEQTVTSRTINDDNTPQWNEEMRFKIEKMGPSQFLKLQVMDSDMLRDDLLGSATLPLYNLIELGETFEDSLVLLDKNEQVTLARIFFAAKFLREL